MALTQEALSKAFDIKFIKNDKERITVEWADKECKWRLYASTDSHGETLVIKTLDDCHACKNVNQAANHMATIGWIKRNVKSHINDDNSIRQIQLSRECYRKYGLQVNYNKIWRAKRLALDKMRGTYDNAYHLVPLLCNIVLVLNLVACYCDEHPNHQFQRVFVMLAGALEWSRWNFHERLS